MNLFLCMVVHTANILGILNDPFEFEGDYGPEMNEVRQNVFDQVVAKEALANNLHAIHHDENHGPTLAELVTPELIEELKKKQQEFQKIGFTDRDLNHILAFIEHYKGQKIFRFLRNNPSELLSLDKILRDKASREGKSFDLPLLSSTEPLKGQSDLELKKNLMNAVFNLETFALTKSSKVMNSSLSKLPQNYLKNFFGISANNHDLEAFSSPAGQIFFYWMYQALNLHLISVDPAMIQQINKVKDLFAQTLGNPKARAQIFRNQLVAAHSAVVFTQESDAIVPQVLTHDKLFLPIDCQNPQDGTFVFLRSDYWEPDYKIISLEGYEGFKKGRLNVILATQKETGQKFLLASAHGNSTKPEDGRLQISLIMEKFHHLFEGNLQLVIGIDANTKTEEDVKAFREHLNKLGLMTTHVGPTTIKKRMVTAQHSKAGKFAIDEEDYLIILKPENGGLFSFSHLTVGFKEEKPDIHKPLPNKDNPSDHYPVGATLVEFLKS